MSRHSSPAVLDMFCLQSFSYSDHNLGREGSEVGAEGPEHWRTQAWLLLLQFPYSQKFLSCRSLNFL